MSISDEDIVTMREWGIHLVRLGVMWESVETSLNFYNMTYLDEVDKLITKFGENGISVIVDAHQDLFSKKTCGEGMPTFYVNDIMTACPQNIPGEIFKLIGACIPITSYNFKTDEDGNPLISECTKNSFTTYYTSPEVCSSFEGLYYNETVQTGFINFWDVVSKRLADN